MTKGHVRAGRCVKPRKKAPGVRCTRQLAAGVLTMQGAPGPNRRTFAARVGPRRLPTGRYRVRVTATDAAGQVSPTKLASFIVLPRKSPR